MQHWKLFFIGLISLFLLACNKPRGIPGYIEGEYTSLASSLSGTLIQLLVTRGQEIKAGQVLYKLDPEPEHSQLDQELKTLAQAKARLIDLQLGQRQTIIQAIQSQREQAIANMSLSKITADRYAELAKTKAISQEQADNAYYAYQRDLNRVKELTSNLSEATLGAREYAIKAQQSTVDTAEAGVKTAEWRLSQKTISTPVAGQVFDTYYVIGEFVPDRGVVVMLLAPQNIYLVFYIPEPQRSSLRIGQAVYFGCDGCKGNSRARIYYISPQAEYTPPVIFSRDSRAKLVFRVRARLELPPGVHFYPGQPVDVYLK